MNKKSVLWILSILLLASCNTMMRTARTAEVSNSLRTATVVDLKPATDQRITHTMRPSDDICRGGENNVKRAVEAEALEKYGNADVLLEPQYVISKRQGLLRSRITSITVSGRPAYYTNFRTLNDTVWCNPVFRGVSPQSYRQTPYVGRSLFAKRESAPFNRELVKRITPFIGTEDGDFVFGALLGLDYQFSPRLSLGAGIGVGLYEGELDDIPLFVNAHLNLTKKEKTPFVELKLGADLYDYEPLYGGGIGYRFGRTDISFQILSYDGYETETCIAVGYRF